MCNLNITTLFRKKPYFTAIQTVRHLTFGLGAWLHYAIDRTFAMAEGSMHMMVQMIPLQHFMTLHQTSDWCSLINLGPRNQK